MALSAAGEQSDHAGLYSFALPVSMQDFTVSLLWHPRLDGDLAHRWVLGWGREVCRAHLARQSWFRQEKRARRVSEPLINDPPAHRKQTTGGMPPVARNHL